MTGFDGLMYDWLQAHADSRPHAPAYRAKLHGLWRSWTWADAAEEVLLIRRRLATAGIGRGSTVALAGEANPRLYWYLLALQASGALPVLLHARTDTAAFAAIRRTAKITHFIGGAPAQAAMAAAATREDGAAPLGLILSLAPTGGSDGEQDGDQDGVTPEAALDPAADLVLPVPSAADHALALPIDEPLHPHDLADAGPGDRFPGIGFPGAVSPGTHGPVGDPASDVSADHPLVALISHDAIAAAAESLGRHLQLGPRDELASFLPIAWTAEIVQFAAALRTGCPLGFAEESSTVLQDLRNLAPTVLIAPGGFYRHVLARAEADLSRASGLARALHRACLRQQRATGQAARRLGDLLDLAFAAPLRGRIGFGRTRLALAIGDSIPSEMLRRYAALGVPLRPAFACGATGRVIAACGTGRSEAGDFGQALPGIDLFQSGARLRYRADNPVTEFLAPGGTLRRLTPDATGCLPLPAQGEIAGDRLQLDGGPTGPQEMPPQFSRALRLVRDNLLVKHAFLWTADDGSFLVAIAPDLDFVRAVASDPGAGIAELLRTPSLLEAADACVAAANAALAAAPGDEAATCAAARPPRLGGYLILPRPLSAERGEVTRNGAPVMAAIAELIAAAAGDGSCTAPGAQA